MATPLCITRQLAADVQRPLFGCPSIGLSHIFELLDEQVQVSLAAEAGRPDLWPISRVGQLQCLSDRQQGFHWDNRWGRWCRHCRFYWLSNTGNRRWAAVLLAV